MCYFLTEIILFTLLKICLLSSERMDKWSLNCAQSGKKLLSACSVSYPWMWKAWHYRFLSLWWSLRCKSHFLPLWEYWFWIWPSSPHLCWQVVPYLSGMCFLGSSPLLLVITFKTTWCNNSLNVCMQVLIYLGLEDYSCPYSFCNISGDFTGFRLFCSLKCTEHERGVVVAHAFHQHPGDRQRQADLFWVPG